MSSITIKTINSEKIYDPYEIVTNFGYIEEKEFLLHNDSTETQNSCRLYFEKTESLGDVDNPGTLEPYIDFEHILKMGNEKMVDPANIGYLGVEIDSELYIIRTSVGSSKKTGIELGSFTGGEKKIVKVKIEAPAAYSSRRFYINMVVG